MLQQGPSALAESRILLEDYAERFGKVCRRNGCKVILYMVLPARATSFDFNNVAASYSSAAEKTRGSLCAFGIAWQNVWKTDPTVSLYGADNFHPGIDGSVVAAMVMYRVVAGK